MSEVLDDRHIPDSPEENGPTEPYEVYFRGQRVP